MDSELWGLFWKAVNFFILAVILYKLLANRLKDFFKNRSATIENEINEADQARMEAERRYEELKKKIENIDQEREELLDLYRKEGLAEKERIIDNAKKEAEKIKEQAKRTVDQEVMKAVSSIRRDYVESIMNMAEELLRKRLTDKDHERVVTDYIEKVVKLN